MQTAVRLSQNIETGMREILNRLKLIGVRSLFRPSLLCVNNVTRKQIKQVRLRRRNNRDKSMTISTCYLQGDPSD